MCERSAQGVKPDSLTNHIEQMLRVPPKKKIQSAAFEFESVTFAMLTLL
jgi:hypothetical protein